MLYAEEELVALKGQVAGYPKTLLSVYLSVPENRGKAYVLRLKNALKAVEAPKDARYASVCNARQPLTAHS